MGRIERFFVWAGSLHATYQILLLASILVGTLALLTGMMSENMVFVGLGVGWLLIGPVVIYIAASNE